MLVKNVTEARNEFSKLADFVTTEHKPVYVKRGTKKPSVMIVDAKLYQLMEKAYSAQAETERLLKGARGEKLLADAHAALDGSAGVQLLAEQELYDRFDFDKDAEIEAKLRKALDQLV